MGLFSGLRGFFSIPDHTPLKLVNTGAEKKISLDYSSPAMEFVKEVELCLHLLFLPEMEMPSLGECPFTAFTKLNKAMKVINEKIQDLEV